MVKRYSGPKNRKVYTRLPEPIYQKIKLAAESSSISMGSYIALVLTKLEVKVGLEGEITNGSSD